MNMTPATFTVLAVILLVSLIVHVAFSMERIAYHALLTLSEYGSLPKTMFCERITKRLSRIQRTLLSNLGNSTLKQLVRNRFVEEHEGNVHITHRGMMAKQDFKTFCRMLGI